MEAKTSEGDETRNTLLAPVSNSSHDLEKYINFKKYIQKKYLQKITRYGHIY